MREFKNVKIATVGDIDTIQGLIYPRSAMKFALANLGDNPIIGQVGSPPTFCHIDYLKVSHVAKDVRMEGDNVYATIKTFDTPLGKIAEKLVEMNDYIAFVLSGVGFISPTKQIESFEIMSVNMVVDYEPN